MIDISSLDSISNHDIIKYLNDSIKNEKEYKVAIVFLIVEIEKRALWGIWGASSSYDYLVSCNGYPPSSATRRIRAARVVKEHPKAANMLIAGQVTISTLSFIKDIINKENSENILTEISGKTYKYVEEFSCLYNPKVKTPDKVSTVGVLEFDKESEELDVSSHATSFLNYGCESDSKKDATSAFKNKKLIKKKMKKFTFTAKPCFFEKVEKAKTLMSSKYPKGLDLETLFTETLEAYLDLHDPQRKEDRRNKRETRKAEKARAVKQEVEVKKTAKSSNSVSLRSNNTVKSNTSFTTGTGRKIKNSFKSTTSSISDSTITNTRKPIPSNIRDAVWIRDGGKCCICGSSHNIQIDHVNPVAHGGTNNISNLRLACQRCNLSLAKQKLGVRYMARFVSV